MEMQGKNVSKRWKEYNWWGQVWLHRHGPRVSAKANLSSFSSKFIYNNHVFKCLFSPAFVPCVLANARFFFYKYPVSITGPRTYWVFSKGFLNGDSYWKPSCLETIFLKTEKRESHRSKWPMDTNLNSLSTSQTQRQTRKQGWEEREEEWHVN